METSPFLQPGFLLSLIAAVVALVAWFIRLEAKIITNGNNINRLEHDLAKLETEVEAHRQNQEIHFNHRISQEVDKRNELKFQHIDNQLKAINEKLDKMIVR